MQPVGTGKFEERKPRRHVLRMEDSRIPRQAIQWELSWATRESRDAQGKLVGHHQTRSEGHGHYLG